MQYRPYPDAVLRSTRQNNSFTKWVDPRGTGETKTELFRRLRRSGEFSDETVQIVEFKTGKSSFRGLGQLTAYEEMVQQDYGWNVEQKILVSAERDAIIDSVSKSKDIRVVNVK